MSRQGLKDKRHTVIFGVDYQGYPVKLELWKSKEGELYASVYGRRVEITEDEYNRLMSGDKRLMRDVVDRIVREGKPYGGHMILDLGVPLPLAVKLLKNDMESGRRPQSIVGLAYTRKELLRLRTLARLVSWRELENLTVEALDMVDSILFELEKGTSMEELYDRISEVYRGWRRSLAYRIMDNLKDVKYKLFRKSWRMKLRGGIELVGRMDGKGNHYLFVKHEGATLRIVPGYAVAGRKRIPLDRSPEELALNISENPDIVADIWGKIIQEGERHPIIRVLDENLGGEERKRILMEILNSETGRKEIFYALSSVEELREVLSLLPSDHPLREEVEPHIPLLQRLEERIRESDTPYYAVVRELKERHPEIRKLPDVIYPFLTTIALSRDFPELF